MPPSTHRVGGGQARRIATDRIRAAILEGGLRPGERLKEKALAERFDTSRTPVREALKVLDMEGLIDFVLNRGARVRSYTVDDLREIYGLRALLEGHAARRAAQWITPKRLDGLRTMCDRFACLHDYDAPVPELVAENVTFHHAVLEAAGSTRLTGMARRVQEMPLIYRSYSWYSPEQRRDAARDHRKLVRAFEMRDPDRAELIMKQHILEGGDVIFDHLGGEALASPNKGGR